MVCFTSDVDGQIMTVNASLRGMDAHTVSLTFILTSYHHRCTCCFKCPLICNIYQRFILNIVNMYYFFSWEPTLLELYVCLYYIIIHLNISGLLHLGCTELFEGNCEVYYSSIAYEMDT